MHGLAEPHKHRVMFDVRTLAQLSRFERSLGGANHIVDLVTEHQAYRLKQPPPVFHMGVFLQSFLAVVRHQGHALELLHGQQP